MHNKQYPIVKIGKNHIKKSGHKPDFFMGRDMVLICVNDPKCNNFRGQNPEINSIFKSLVTRNRTEVSAIARRAKGDLRHGWFRIGISWQGAAKKIGMTQPKLSRFFNGHFHGISETKLVEYITQLGSDIEIAG